jgi:hypothetical protein
MRYAIFTMATLAVCAGCAGTGDAAPLLAAAAVLLAVIDVPLGLLVAAPGAAVLAGALVAAGGRAAAVLGAAAVVVALALADDRPLAAAWPAARLAAAGLGAFSGYIIARTDTRASREVHYAFAALAGLGLAIPLGSAFVGTACGIAWIVGATIGAGILKRGY